MLRQAVITIEVLIALVIMFSAVVLTTSSVRTLTLFKLKKEKYEINYTTVLSLKAMLENREFAANGGNFQGNINGFDYTIDYKPLKKNRTFILGETKASTGNYGAYEMTLYNCVLNLVKENSYSKSTFQILKYIEIKTDD